VRLVADFIRGKTAVRAKKELGFLKKRAALPWSKLLDSALANAKNNFQLEEKNLYLAKVLVDEGPKLKRWRPRSRGRAFPIQKKTSHLTIILGVSAEAKGAGIISRSSSLPKKTEASRGLKTEKPKFKAESPARVNKADILTKRVFRRKSF
jgi:large subunit ribosomal protein L22